MAQLGFGCILNKRWFRGDWNSRFIKSCCPSIAYLELFALCAGLMTWSKYLTNCRINIFCDNQDVVHMINDLTSNCKNCMFLIRMITLDGLKSNCRFKAKYVKSKDNFLADSLSHNQMLRFRRLGAMMNERPDLIHLDMWPMTNLWLF